MISEEEAKYSLKNLLQKPGRSFFTILSILMGITTIFIFISFGIGLYNYVDQFASESSSDKITIMPKGVGAPGMDDTFAITDKDVKAIESILGVEEVSALYSKVAELKQDKIKKYSFLIGYNPENPIIFEISNINVYKGRWLKKGETGKVLLGYNYMIKDKIFPKSYDLNSKIEIQGKEFRIIGFLDSVGNPQDDSQVYVTKEDVEGLYANIKGYNFVMAQIDTNNFDNIIKRVEDALRDSRDVEKGKEDFFVQSWRDMMETYSSVLDGIIGFVILIALISVIVSAINTANTLITSVLERTKEIGVMKAVGAKNSEIFSMFLFESAILGFLAGVFGVFFGWLISLFFGNLLNSFGWGFLSPAYPWYLFIGLILFATLTGAISGAIPAWNASKVNPVQALRYE